MAELPCGRSEMCGPCVELESAADRALVCESVGFVAKVVRIVPEALGVTGPEDLTSEELYDMTSAYVFAESGEAPSPEIREAAAESAADLYHLNV